MISRSDTRSVEIHLETSPAGPARAGVPAATACSSNSSLPVVQFPPGPAALPETVEKTATAAASLFGDALPSVPTPQEQLRDALQEAFRRRRGTQSRVAKALHLSRHTLSNVLAGRERFTPTAAAALRRWLDGEPMLADWPHLPPAKDEGEPDAAA
jgi:DNA-binding XRE family transcriptional regulator